MDDLYRIVAPHFVAGIIVRNDRVWRTAPILKWMWGKKFSELHSYFNRKRWTYERL